MKTAITLAAVLLLACAMELGGQAQPPAKPNPIEEVAEVQRDIEYSNVGGVSIKLDLYRPKILPKGAMPVIVWFHGGGWSGGTRQFLAMSKPETFVQSGYCFVSVDYRLSGVAKCPAAVEDCRTAIRWVRQNAQKYDFDSNRIGAFGYSAGGHLAMMMGCGPDKVGGDGPSSRPGDANATSGRVQAVCAFAGPSDLTAFPKGSMGEKALGDFCGGTVAEKAEIYKQASPINYVARANPPILLIQGEADEIVPIAQSDNMFKKLKDAGVKVQYIRIKNYTHGGPVSGKQPDPGLETIQKAIHEFFDSALRPVAQAK